MKYKGFIKKFFPNAAARRWIFRNTRKRLPRIILLCLLRIFDSVFGIVFAFISKDLVNYSIGGNADGFWKTAVFFVAFIAVKIACSTYAFHLQEKLLYVLDADVKQSVFHDILAGDYPFVSKYHSGDLLQRINSDANGVASCVITIFSSLLSLVTGLISAAVVLFAMEPLLTVCILPVCIILALVALLFEQNLKSVQKDMSQSIGTLSGFYHETIEKLLIVQSLNIAGEIEKKSDSLLDERNKTHKKYNSIQVKMNLANSLFSHAGSLIALIWCAYQVLTGTIDYGTLVAITALVSQVQGPLLAIPSIMPRFIYLTACTERILEVIGSGENETVTDNGSCPVYEAVKCIRGVGLSFEYPEQEERKVILNGFDFEIEPGGMTVLTGSSGCGKSTLLKLLLGIYRPTGGELVLEMKNGDRIPVTRENRRLFSFAPQGNLILSGTIRENIMITNPSATAEELENAVYVSAMDDYIRELPLGLDTVLGENGAGLSEGQVQRINIARAVISGAPILLLDEVTSSLDMATEKTVLERIHGLPGRTCIAVTHRPAALEIAEHRIHFPDGSI